MSTLQMTLPAHAPPATRLDPGILIVDDDVVLLNLLSLMLRREGFQVWTAVNGVKAVEAYRQHRQRIAVVLLDVRMPVQDGPETLSQLQALNPQLPCCFMSGDTGAYTLDELLAKGARCCFEKPFHLEEVTQTLRGLAKAA